MHQTDAPTRPGSGLGLIRARDLKKYLGYVLPSMAALMLSSVFVILDGVFVGHAVGDAGLAGINVAYPLITLVNAVSMGIGMGGAVISSIERGRGSEQEAVRANGNAFLILGIIGIPLALLLNLVAEPLCAVMGGSGQTLTEAVHFVRAVSIGTPFQAIALGSLAMVRNRGDVRYAMCVQIIATSINIALDFLFVFELGLGTFGAGLATVFGQIFSFCAYLRYFTRPKNRIPREAFRPHGATIAHMAKLGLAPFGLFLLPDVTTVVININANAAGGEVAVAAFAAMAYVGYIALMLMQGIADGSQPLVSLCHGQGDHDQVQRLRNTNYVAACGLGLVGLAVLVLIRAQVPGLFGASEATAAVVVGALPLYALSFVFYGFTHVSMSYFYATDNARASNFLVYGEAVVIAVVASLMTLALGITGTWLAVAAAQVVLSAVAIVELWAVEHSRAAGRRRGDPHDHFRKK